MLCRGPLARDFSASTIGGGQNSAEERRISGKYGKIEVKASLVSRVFMVLDRLSRIKRVVPTFIAVGHKKLKKKNEKHEFNLNVNYFLSIWDFHFAEYYFNSPNF